MAADLPARMQRFLNNTQQAQGTVLLSLPLDGEGRSQTNGKQSNTITVTFPDRPNDAVEAIYVIAHEAVSGSCATTAVTDNITPEQRRTGARRTLSERGGGARRSASAPAHVAGDPRRLHALLPESVNRPVGANVQTTFTSHLRHCPTRFAMRLPGSSTSYSEGFKQI